MDKYAETFQTWNKLASLYEDKFMHLDLYDATYDAFCSAIDKAGPNIFEVGCGPGNITQYLLRKRPDMVIYGTDIAPNMVELARKNNPTARFDVMDCREIGNLDAKFDGIIGGFSLPYLDSTEAERFIADSYNLLNDGGLIYISFVAGDPNLSGFKASNAGDRVYFHYHELSTIKTLLTSSQFTMLNEFNVDYGKASEVVQVHTIIIAQKQLSGHVY